MYTRMYMRCLQALLNPTIDTGAGRALSTAYGLARTAWMTTCMYHKPSEKPWMRSTYQRIVLGPLIGRSSSVSHAPREHQACDVVELPQPAHNKNTPI